jgi:hypothetical protein
LTASLDSTTTSSPPSGSSAATGSATSSPARDDSSDVYASATPGITRTEPGKSLGCGDTYSRCVFAQ